MKVAPRTQAKTKIKTDLRNPGQVSAPPLCEAWLRLRLGSQDAHYGGGLVDGARILGLFGDVATELLIRLDGDEGLFRAYENVEFLAPVFAGDYVEVVGRLVGVGKTSRQMEFEAYKVIQSLAMGGGGKTPSSAEVLSEPLLLCRAKGTCVTPLDLQSAASENKGSGIKVSEGLAPAPAKQAKK